MNQEDARILAKKIHHYLVNTNKRMRGKSAFDFNFTEVARVAQQSNGYDCGLHALANAEHATRHLMVYGSPSGLASLEEKEVKDLRSHIRALIQKQSGLEEGNRR